MAARFGLQGVSGMAERVALSSGGLLRQLRAEANLTQEGLPSSARLSPRSAAGAFSATGTTLR